MSRVSVQELIRRLYPGMFVNTGLVSKVKRSDVWWRLLVERLSEPLHLNLASLAVALFGNTTAKIKFDLIFRQQYAFGLQNAAAKAAAHGLTGITVIEFGVASGTGLLNLCGIAGRLSHETGMQFRIVGFDTGVGMPSPRDYRDHPEVWQAGDYPMTNPEGLRKRLPSNAKLVIGDISDTVPQFLSTLRPDFPLGFVSVDVDYYSSAFNALRVFEGDAKYYLDRINVYFDDVSLDASNKWCGELLAIEEFNESHRWRKIDRFNLLRQKRLFKNAIWIDQMYSLHVLDHPWRAPSAEKRSTFVYRNPYLL